MIPAAYGVIRTHLELLDTSLDLEGVPGDDIAAMWQEAAAICRAADSLYNKLRGALTNEFIRERP